MEMGARQHSVWESPNNGGHAASGDLAFGEAIRARRLALGLTIEQVGSAVGCGKGYVSMLERGQRRAVEDVAKRLESVLGMDAGSLLTLACWARTPLSVQHQLRELAARLAESEARSALVALDADTRGMGRRASHGFGVDLDALHRAGALRAIADSEAPVEGSIESALALGKGLGSGMLPLEVPLINAVAAGYPAEFTDLGYPARVADEYVRVPEVGDPDAFAARVVGESMLPEYREGDIVVFSPNKPLKDGMDCFVRLEHDAQTTFKRVYIHAAGDDLAAGSATHLRLVPLNPAFEEQVYPREEIAGVYPAVSVTRRIGDGPKDRRA